MNLNNLNLDLSLLQGNQNGFVNSCANEIGQPFFIPNGFNVILIPKKRNKKTDTSQPSGLELKKHVPRTTPASDNFENAIKSLSEKWSTNKKRRFPPRPPNSFILYRKDKQSLVLKEKPGSKISEISKKIGEMWKNELPVVKSYYQSKANNEKDMHLIKYPGYKYRPRKANTIKRRAKKNSISNLTIESFKPSSSPELVNEVIDNNNPCFEIEDLSTYTLNDDVNQLYSLCQTFDFSQQLTNNNCNEFDIMSCL